jgi:hypothetical protein
MPPSQFLNLGVHFSGGVTTTEGRAAMSLENDDPSDEPATWGLRDLQYIAFSLSLQREASKRFGEPWQVEELTALHDRIAAAILRLQAA